MTTNKAGLGAPGQRFAPSLGLSDARMRNPGTAETQGELTYEKPLEITKRRKVGLKLGRGLRIVNGALEVDLDWLRANL